MPIFRRTTAPLFLSLVALFLLTACRNAPSAASETSGRCAVDSQKVELSLNAIHLAVGIDNLRRLAYANQPNAEGALSRNITAYFHVRFQLSVSTLSLYGVLAQNPAELEKAVKTIEYSFSYQKSEGDFQLVTPPSLASMLATEADLASGTAFFLSSLGLALSSMQESSWFQTSQEAKPYKARIDQLRPKIEAALKNFLEKKNILLRSDAQAPNRLLFDALAYQTLGAYLGNSQAQEIATTFIQAALALQHESGYFKEGSGYDSSYQGVGLSVGWNVYLLLPAGHILKSRLWQSLACGTEWLRSRVAATGEISTQGNSRVYPGGEKFLGEEKGMAWKDAVFSAWYYFHLSQNQDFKRLGDTMLKFYGA